jgi:tyrosyl-tRNA synthetase
MRAEVEHQCEVFRAHAVDLVHEAELRERLATGRALRIKLGCDPSAPDLHLGHVVQLDALRAFQELGHRIIFLVGDFTARIGDPSGRSKTRPALSREEVERNARTYVDQVSAVLDVDRIELRFNSEWMDRMTPSDLIRLASHQTVARMLERDDFDQRYRSGTPIAIHEFLYPLVQAYDSVALEADVEIGGTDQLFNLLLGREIQRGYGQAPQIVLTRRLLEGTDGLEKMSKSLGNAIGIREAPEEMYGKTMSIPDRVLVGWVRCVAPGRADLQRAADELESGDGSPRDLKAALARHVVARFHGEGAASAAESHFDRLFRQHRPPADVPRHRLPASEAGGVGLAAALEALGVARSRGEARRLIRQGGVRVDEARIEEADFKLAPEREYLVQVGKRRFARILVGAPPGACSDPHGGV